MLGKSRFIPEQSLVDGGTAKDMTSHKSVVDRQTQTTNLSMSSKMLDHPKPVHPSPQHPTHLKNTQIYASLGQAPVVSHQPHHGFRSFLKVIFSVDPKTNQIISTFAC